MTLKELLLTINEDDKLSHLNISDANGTKFTGDILGSAKNLLNTLTPLILDMQVGEIRLESYCDIPMLHIKIKEDLL